ncbi:hypothetical protein GALL_486920 [mine drainage metagenome]|uniref:Uncharacterized protein n=1 Tax=mine drainage metagenome TaxID=410659 RepID=A0A1J5PDJ5_9ZZZZ
MAEFKNCPGLAALTHFDVARFALEAAAVAVCTGLGRAVPRQVFAHYRRVGVPVAPLHVRNDALERVFFADFLATVT